MTITFNMIIQPTTNNQQPAANSKPKSFTALNINQCTSLSMAAMKSKVEKSRKIEKTKNENIEYNAIQVVTIPAVNGC